MITKEQTEKNLENLNTESLAIYSLLLEVLNEDNEIEHELKKYILKKASKGENIRD